jgi:hypothetical protein
MCTEAIEFIWTKQAIEFISQLHFNPDTFM